MPKCLLDTSAYIDFQRAWQHQREVWAVNTLRHIADCIANQGRPYLGTPSLMEIVHGLKPPSALEVFRQEVLPTFEVIPFHEDAACLAGQIYAKLEIQGLRIGIPDTQTAAIAIIHGLTLTNSNTKHFQRIIDLGYPLQLANWREP